MEFDQSSSKLSAGGDINSRNVNNNQHTVTVNQFLHPPFAAQPGLASRCPLPSLRFTGRTRELDKLEDFFFGASNVDETSPLRKYNPQGKRRISVVYGIGGCGKTQLCRSFIHTRVNCRLDASSVFYVDATTESTLTANFELIARSSGRGDTLEIALFWLANLEDVFFLYIENADDPTFNLHPFLPRTDYAYVLITPRLRDAAQHYGTTVDDCGPLQQDEAHQLLLNTCSRNGQPEEARVADEIVKELHSYALAVVQAGAGIFEMQCTTEEYLEDFRHLRTELMDGQLSGVRGAALDGYTTWSLSYNRLTPDAASLACLCAHLHHTGITERLFRDARSSIHK